MYQKEPEKIEIEKVIKELKKEGFNWVYINLFTGKYKGEKCVVDFALGIRKDCYYIGNDEEQKRNHHLTEDNLKSEIYRAVCCYFVKLVNVED